MLKGHTPGDPNTIPPARSLLWALSMHVTHTACTDTDVAKTRRQQRPLCARVPPCLHAPCPYLRCPFCAQARHLPDCALPMPRAFYLHAFATSLLRGTHLPTPARVQLCSLYLLCTSCPLFSVVVITVCAKILSLYPIPFSLSLLPNPHCLPHY